MITEDRQCLRSHGARGWAVLGRQLRNPLLPLLLAAAAARGVTVAYEGSQPVLRDIDLEVAAGATLALVGPTGSGKTTLAALIPRLYDPIEGSVLIDGADVREVRPDSLRHQVALVSDDAFLFSATLREHIGRNRKAP